jgi:hypothetical protein
MLTKLKGRNDHEKEEKVGKPDGLGTPAGHFFRLCSRGTDKTDIKKKE